MPQTLCCVPRCSNRGGHGFPANEMLKQQWIVAIKRVREDGKNGTPQQPVSAASDIFFA